MFYRSIIALFLLVSFSAYTKDFTLTTKKETATSSTRGCNYTKEELKVLRLKAESGDVRAATEYGYYLALFTDNNKKAISYLKSAADNEYPRAMYLLIVFNDERASYYLEKPEKMSKTDEEAKYWLECLEM